MGTFLKTLLFKEESLVPVDLIQEGGAEQKYHLLPSILLP